jgi:hypothetical protein
MFYASEGLEDLREKYGYKNSMESISGFVSANLNSKKEEIEIKDFLKQFFNKTSYQVYVKFKRKEESEKVRIIDLIVSDEETVYLIEIKRHNFYINEEQLELYYELVDYLMKTRNDIRELKSLFIVNEFYENTFNQVKCVQFESLKLKNKKVEILTELNSQIYA